MTTQLAMDFDSALVRREQGTKATLEKEPDPWRDHAMGALAVFALQRGSFLAEHFRYNYLASGHTPPHSHKVWGALFLAAAKAGIIEPTGEYRKAASPGTHAHPVRVWRFVGKAS